MDVGDIDLACQLEPQDVIEALKAVDIRYIPTGIDHGTVTSQISICWQCRGARAGRLS